METDAKALNWDTLPTEIILIILAKIIKNGDSPFPCQLVNKHWYVASISTVYKSITFKFKGKDFKDWEKLDKFCQVFKNTTIGPCIKEFTFHHFHDHLYLLGLIMKHSPNIEHISVGSSRKVCDYVTSVQKHDKDAVLWENVKRVDAIMPYNHPGNYFYRYLYVFRNSLEYLHLASIPSIFNDIEANHLEELVEEESDIDSDSSSEFADSPIQNGNTMNNLCSYIKEFKNLKSLHLSGYAINKLMDCVEFLPFCSNTLEELYFNFYPSNRPDIMERPLSPAQEGDGFIATSVKKLVIRNYRPDSVRSEISYIKNTFPNLVDIDIDHSSERVWDPLTREEVSMMTNYVLTLPRYRLAVGHTVNFQLVKHFFKVYMEHSSIRSVKIDFMTATLEGITMENYIEKTHPLMRIRLNSTPLQDRDAILPEAVMSYASIIGYLGQYLHKLDIFDFNSVAEERKVPNYHAQMLNSILKDCPHLQELSVSGNMDIDIDGNTKKHMALHTIKFKEINKFPTTVSSFFKKLSARAPNLRKVYLDLDRSDGCIQLSLPFTMDLELEICFRGHLISKMENNLKMEEEVTVVITTAGNDKSRYYSCSASGFTSIPKINHLNWVHICNNTCQHNSSGGDTKSLSGGFQQLKANFHIRCSSFKTFRLSTGFDYHLRV